MINRKEYFGRQATREEMIDSILVETQRREGDEENLLVISTILGTDDWTDEEVKEQYNEMF